MNTYIFTGPIESGKTTRLLQWSQGRRNVQGILMPGHGNQRRFHDLGSGEEWPAAAPAEDSNPVLVGRYRFSRTALERAIAVLDGVSVDEGWIVVDEVGKLELHGAGFAEALRRLLRKARANGLLLVVRDGLVAEVRERYGLREATVIRDLSALPGALPNS